MEGGTERNKDSKSNKHVYNCKANSESDIHTRRVVGGWGMVKRSDSVRDLSDLQLKCHLYRHNFAEPDIYLEHYTRVHPTGNSDGWVMVHVCDCGVQRFDYVEPETYELWDRKYWYTKADGYLVSFPATTQDYRAEVIRRRHSRKT